MESDQIEKRLNWIEKERRDEKDAIARLEGRLTTLEGGILAATKQISEMSSEITRLAEVMKRMDQYDSAHLQQRIEAKRGIEELDKETRKREEEAEKVRRVELKAVENQVAEVRKELDAIPKLEKGLSARAEEEVRLRRSLEELRERVEGLRRDEEEYTRTYRLLEDGRRQDAKRLNDMQGEMTALRKQTDTQRGQVDVINVGLRKVETRINELVAVEMERRDAMGGFLDKQALTQVERDRIWRDWQTRFETIEKQAADIEAQLLALETTHREAKRAQTLLEELSQRVERRINEITEIQRLSEDRFRQEWVTFKADDQKRWTNYTLTQEEQRGEVRRQYEKMSEQVTHLEDGLQETHDLLLQVNDLSQKRLQSLLALAHEWVSTYERTAGRAR